MYREITYRETQYPIRVGYSAMKAVKEKHGLSMSKITDDDIDVYETILEAALISGHKAKGLEMPANLDYTDMLDEVFMDFVAMVPEFFAEKKSPGNGRKKK